MERETAEEIDNSAAMWAARTDRDLTPSEEVELELWLAGDSRRTGAYARMLWAVGGDGLPVLPIGTIGRLEEPRADEQSVAVRNRFSRRQWLLGGGALAASTAGLALVPLWNMADHSTRRGEKKVIALEDGSVITLNTQTDIQVHYSHDRRNIRLLSGEALFDVAKDRKRPFVVSIHDTEVRAVGTSFTVSDWNGDNVKVIVREGVVAVSKTRGNKPPEMRVVANNSATTAMGDQQIVVAAVPPAVLGADTAWIDGRLVFRGETLADAANEFRRYSDTDINILDPALRAEKVAGVFDVNDPVGFARSVALSLNARIEVGANEVRLLR
jgi:transmembrane sensor